jgi:hypothetical protein
MGKHSHPDDQPNLRPGQHDEGSAGGMATRELAASQLDEHGQPEDDER